MGTNPNNLANTIKNKVIDLFLHHIKLTQEVSRAMLIILLTD